MIEDYETKILPSLLQNATESTTTVYSLRQVCLISKIKFNDTGKLKSLMLTLISIGKQFIIFEKTNTNECNRGLKMYGILMKFSKLCVELIHLLLNF